MTPIGGEQGNKKAAELFKKIWYAYIPVLNDMFKFLCPSNNVFLLILGVQANRESLK